MPANVYKTISIVYNPPRRQTGMGAAVQADVVIRNGVVRTLDRSGTTAEALAIAGDRIIGVGRNDEIDGTRGPGTAVLDVRGQAILPAFTDSHTHFKRATIVRAFFIDFREVNPSSIDDVLAAVAAKAETLPPGGWVQGDGLNDLALAERRLPVRRELDAVSGNRPVVLRTIGRHVVAANSLALQLAGIDRDTRAPTGGRIDHDGDGEPTGVLHEQAKLRLDMTSAETVIPRLATEDRLHALEQGMRYLHRHGIGTIHEMAREPDEIGDYQRLRERGGLTTRVRVYIRGIESSTRLENLLALGLRAGLGDEWFRLGGVKFSIDGSGLARNAAVYEPYPGEPGNTGLLRIEQDELDRAVAAAHEGGLQVALHAVGPRAFDMALQAFERIENAVTLKAMRHRIEHAYYPPRPGQMERLLGLNLVWSTQPAEIAEVGEDWIRIFGRPGLAGLMPLRSALELGVPTVINSDYPVTTINPFVCVGSAVTRRTEAGTVLGIEEAVSVDAAIRMMTVGPAWVEGMEGVKGSLEPGKLADLIVVAADPFAVPPERLGRLEVTTTMVGGVTRYSREFETAEVTA